MTHPAGPAGGNRWPGPPGRRTLTASFSVARTNFFLAVFLLFSGTLAAVAGLARPC
jgi:hypothetical protein